MTLVDTSVWIDFLRGREPIREKMAVLLNEQQVCSVECIFGELLVGAKDRKEIGILESYWRNISKAPETDIWIEAGKLSSAMKLPSKGVGLIDAAILVAGRRANAVIWTLDEKLKGVLGKDSY